MALCLPPHGVVAIRLEAELAVPQLDISGGRRRLVPALIVLDAAQLQHHLVKDDQLELLPETCLDKDKIWVMCAQFYDN